MNEGRVQDFEQFDREFRQEHGIATGDRYKHGNAAMRLKIFPFPVSLSRAFAMSLFVFCAAVLFAGWAVAQAPPLPPYKDASRPAETRVDDLLQRMTLEEKVDLLGGDEFMTKPNVRLGIPVLVMSDGPLGPSRRGRSTNYSSMVNLAATFDVDLMRTVAENIGEETRVMGCNMLLAPMPTIARVPHGGRAFECFGEDPYLAARMTVAHVKGVQSKRVAACTKVIAANNQEWNRFDVDVRVDERALREIYLPAFRAAVLEADTWTIMCAYNQVRGDYCCENRYLLTNVLKKEWGFTGAVVSDWGGARTTVKMALSGMDLEMPFGKFYGEKLLQAARDGRVAESIIDGKVQRILRVMFRVGLFDETVEAYGGHSDTPERRALALLAARKSIVLLKNENHFLPLKKEGLKRIALIGPNAAVARMCGGGSGALRGNYGISPLQGIQDRVSSETIVRFERGVQETFKDLPIAGPEHYIQPDGKPGIRVEYFNNRELQGAPVLTRIDKQINFDWGYGANYAVDGPGTPAPGIVNLDKWSARWTGRFVSPGDGAYEIGMKADNGVRLYLDGKKVIDAWTDGRPGEFKIARYEFVAGRQYDLRVEFYENWGSCRCALGFAPGQSSARLPKAVELARQSDVAILCLGLNENLEGEAVDRDELGLPEEQVKLIQEVSRANERTVVVLNNGTPITMNEWLDNVPAVVDALYPGQEGGRAVAEVLLGEVNPSGRLPMTFPKRWEDSPAYGSYPGEKQVAHYREGIFVGYRHFDRKNIEPLFPFGHGLSYTTFEYCELKITPDTLKQDGTATVQLLVRNTGQMAGEEVVQMYIGDVEASVEREVRALKGFARISLKPGESKTVTFTVDKSHLSFYSSERKQWVAEPGAFEVAIGVSSRDIRLTGKLILR
jgi:beta-glucosidase